MFAAAIRPAPGGYEIDYRMDLNGAQFSAVELPTITRQRIAKFMEALGLVYGAIDLRRTHDGSDVFLEVNPSGEWLFVEQRTGQPITGSMATLLASIDGDSTQ